MVYSTNDIGATMYGTGKGKYEQCQQKDCIANSSLKAQSHRGRYSVPGGIKRMHPALQLQANLNPSFPIALRFHLVNFT